MVEKNCHRKCCEGCFAAEADWQLERERQRFRIAIESTSAIVFEYDILNDHYHAYGTLENTKKKHSKERVFDHFSTKYLPEIFHPDYKEAVWNLFQGREANELEVKMVHYYGSQQMVWAKISTQVFYDGKGKPVSVIGKVRDIQSEKEKEFALWETKVKDRLTGLYSREYGVKLVQEYLETKPKEQVCALMLLDMDEFKRFNKEEGEGFADAVLQDVADILRSETGPEDILVRLGGDEFMLFVKDCDKERAAVLGPEIVSKIQNLVPSPDNCISASVGMCVTTVADQYVGLYRSAESTLKYVKEKGKGQAACYLDGSNEMGTFLTKLYTEAHLINEISGTGAGVENLTSFALDLLGNAKNLNDAMSFLLARVGKSCGLDRVSVMEVDPLYLSSSIPYQWMRDSRDQLDGDLFYLEQDMFSHIFEKGEELSQVSIGEKRQFMPSCLYEAICSRETYAGVLIFERKDRRNLWSQEEKKLVTELAMAIGSFLMRARADALSQAKTDFLSRMSHEIRTPMNAIMGMTAIAKSKVDDREAVLDCMDKIEAANQSLLELVDDILDLSRMERGPHKIPLAEGTQAKECRETSLPPKKQKQNGFQGERILIVEDNELNREIAETILQIQGLTTESVSNGKEAVQAFQRAEAGYYDGILMDIRMPVMDGLEATRKIRGLGKKDSQSIPIIALTANAFDGDIESSMESGMNGHLRKPIEVKTLVNVLQKMCRKKEG